MSEEWIEALIIFGWIFGGMFLCGIATLMLDIYYYPGMLERKRIAKEEK